MYGSLTYAILSVSMVSRFARAVVWTLGIIANSIRTAVVGFLSTLINIWKRQSKKTITRKIKKKTQVRMTFDWYRRTNKANIDYATSIHHNFYAAIRTSLRKYELELGKYETQCGEWIKLYTCKSRADRANKKENRKGTITDRKFCAIFLWVKTAFRKRK